MKKIIFATLFAILAQSVAPANAVGNASSVEALLAGVVPQVYAQTSDSSEVKITRDVSNQELGVMDNGPGIENSQVAIRVQTDGLAAIQSGDLTVIGSSQSDFQQVVQPLDVGFRVLNISKNASAPTEYSFELDLPTGATAELVMGTVRVVRGDEILGSIKEPWALDAAGNVVETWFSLDGTEVTQHLTPLSVSSYPIVSDPNWGYIGVWNLNGSYKVAWERLHTCFNCYFPVAGAPSKWPIFGQLLPLKVGVINMECRMNYVFTATKYYRWKFLATKNHLDGEGSNIIFDLRVLSTGQSQLVVDAFIVRDIPLLGGNEAYELLARLNWANFATNLNSY